MLNPSIKFALLAMALIGAADTINKRARLAAVPIGSYLLIQTAFFTCTILIITLLRTGFHVTHTDFLYSLIGALFSFAAFTLMLHSLTYGYASINYAIFRLSFIFSSAAAIIFLNELLTVKKGIGIILAILAILLFFYNFQQLVPLKKSFILAICAMILSACFQFILKVATKTFTSSPSFLLLMSFFFSVMVIMYNIIVEKFKIPRITFLYAPINGVMMALGTLFLIIALLQGEASIVFPIIQLSFLITVVLSATFLNEKMNPTRITGVIFAAVAVAILGWF